ncbi:2-iminoacetate synthase ThiH [Puia dinghuensis]|uniref:Thiamine biosynthesis protein ThiH n=1 Tax=Puia dinghuensis TaxID=1792502 RepID=A0A8J2XTE9_9BACT|nr:2-iminoacetate synthase ThiH [Puia dinghuensis]GGB16764.1 thiamine biosynthesis protein ThiH [Puia dinghuensis]
MFSEVFDKYEWGRVKQDIYSKTARDVERALGKPARDLEDLKALLSPVAAPYLEEMARLSQQVTQKRFGKVIQLYIPLYLSNECQNICTYCGFSYENRIARRTLSAGELLTEVSAIKEMGYEHVLLVSGEANQTVGVDYFVRALDVVRPHFAHLSMEVQPLDQAEYSLLMEHGLHTVLVYQETYHREDYRLHHPRGRKSNFGYRLETPDRLGKAGIYKMGLGVLIGLEDWRTDSWFTGLHLRYLENRYWRTRYSISFPRLRPHAGEEDVRLRPSSGGITPKVEMSDRELVQLICAYRLLDEEVELSLSTRESPVFRDHVVRLGITSMSAGSRTNPGGYAVDRASLEQFEIHDHRSPAEIAAMIRRQGYDAVWKDWDTVLQMK